ncbi:MAG: ABC transporter ATP-binding protein [Desulfobacula sp.]|uniref:ABC transporter ATP-binding protein n=1 Tax=Desulfobacula sp. TaxID=2593537 RepID=UPI0025BD315A|nr:ABC transporter ATP-binding protein [Desulfobacula sp.]MCD4718371.1 ABC transporter ATP-binding protein [Desulfobacula sp.]
MSSDIAISFNNVSKKFSKSSKQYGTLRENIMDYFFPKKEKKILRKDEFWALDSISFSIKKGESIGLYGPNGSGKSTLLKLIANVISPTSGNINVHGRTAPLIELGAGFHPDLNGLENIYMNGAILGMTIGEIRAKMDQIVEYSELSDFILTPVKKYSSGMRLRLGFSVAIHSDADIFLFDEILAVGDENFKKKSLESIKELSDASKTLLIVSHDKKTLTDMTDRIIYICKGTTQNN